MKKVLSIILLVFVMSFVFCDQASIVRNNLERQEQNFDVYRKVVFYNCMNGEHVLTIEGKLAIVIDTDGDLVVTVKTEKGEYLKHYLGLASFMTYFSEQIEANKVPTSGYRVIFKPSVIVPLVEVK